MNYQLQKKDYKSLQAFPSLTCGICRGTWKIKVHIEETDISVDGAICVHLYSQSTPPSEVKHYDM